MLCPKTGLWAASGLALASVAAAVTIRVDVGLNGLSYDPNMIAAKVGDELEFHFHAGNHSAVMGDFNNACQPAGTGGFFSGFINPSGSNSEADNIFRVTINSTDTLVFYCAQNAGSHCKSGMAGVVNPSQNETLKAYQDAAKSVSSASAPASVFGGSVLAASMAQVTTAPSPNSNSGGGGGGGGLYGGGGSGGSNSAGHVHASVGIVGALALGMAVMLV